jgi:hypothetical protein
MAESTGCGITHCYAGLPNHPDNMSVQEAYNLKGRHDNVQGDTVLSVAPGTPLMLTENINTTLGDIPPTRLTFLGLVNGTIVEFHGF